MGLGYNILPTLNNKKKEKKVNLENCMQCICNQVHLTIGRKMVLPLFLGPLCVAIELKHHVKKWDVWKVFKACFVLTVRKELALLRRA